MPEERLHVIGFACECSSVDHYEREICRVCAEVEAKTDEAGICETDYPLESRRFEL